MKTTPLLSLAAGRADRWLGMPNHVDLRTAKLFSNLDAHALREAEWCAVRQTFRRGSRVFAQGDEARRLYLVVDGTVRLSRNGAEGREFSIGFVGPGGTFGEEAVFAKDCYLWDATCNSFAQVIVLGRAQLRRCLRADPGLAVNVAATFHGRLEQTTRALECLAYDRVGTRLLELFKRLARELGIPDVDGTTFPLEFTHRDIASMIASTRETVSLELKNLVRSGRIRFQGRRVVTLCGFHLDASEQRVSTSM
jgi:CRP/FNR family cyclic AMP-dependent transcriptional regulator